MLILIMKRFCLLIYLLFLYSISFGQLYVKEDSFRRIDTFVMNDREEHIDGNGKPMALIKISTENITAEERGGFYFKGNLETDFNWSHKIGEIYLYLTAHAATFIEIKHNDFGKISYKLPEELCDFCCYELVIGRDYNIVNEELYSYLIINTDQEDASIYINEKYVGKHRIKEPMAIDSIYSWSVKCPYYYTETGEVSIIKGSDCQIDLNLNPSHGFLDVISSPSGASVFINGDFMGETPYLSDKLESGNYVVEVKQNGYHSVKKTISICDGIIEKEEFVLFHKGRFFVNLNYAYSIAPQHSYGFTFGKVKKIGWYFSAMSNFDFKAMSYNYVCDKIGSTDGNVNYYNGETVKTRYSIIAGITAKISKYIYIKAGAGYGDRILSWETTNNQLVKNTEYSYNGIDGNIGLMFAYRRLSVSIDFVSTNLKSIETKFGIGLFF